MLDLSDVNHQALPVRPKKRDRFYTECVDVREWLIDTGCGHDLLYKHEVAPYKDFFQKAKSPVVFHTANGSTTANNVARIHVTDLNENITPYVMANSPPVLTVGHRCMNKGYSLIWPSGKDPYFVRPDGMVTHVKVKGYIPYLVPGMLDCQPQKP
ncbi:MAG: hypothetical protein ACKPKO_65165, partial [Candidatus Fonsibacter sp.]